MKQHLNMYSMYIFMFFPLFFQNCILTFSCFQRCSLQCFPLFTHFTSFSPFLFLSFPSFLLSNMLNFPLPSFLMSAFPPTRFCELGRTYTPGKLFVEYIRLCPRERILRLPLLQCERDHRYYFGSKTLNNGAETWETLHRDILPPLKEPQRPRRSPPESSETPRNRNTSKTSQNPSRSHRNPNRL